jgi:hypothetical protein
MFKLLRKYNKLLLAIFGVLLMITFLIPQAIEQFSRQSGQSRATVATVGDGEKVSGDEWFNTQQEVQFIQRIGISFPFLPSAERLKPEHWYLLVREAEAAGLIGPRAVTEDQLRSFAAMGQTRDLNFVRDTIAKIGGVNQLVGLYQSGGMYSDRRLKHAAERMLHQVVASTVVIEASPDGAAEPTVEEINAQFTKYADQDPGTNEDGFGYRLPDRAKIEWIHVAAPSIRAAVEASEAFSTLAQRYHWRQHEGDAIKNFPKVENGPVPQAVKNDLLDKLTTEKTEEIARFASEQLRLNRRGIPEREGYVVLPDDWSLRKLAFPDLAQSVQQRFSVELPAYQAAGDRWLSIKEIGELEGIGAATTDKFGPTSITLPQLVQQSKELRKEGVTSAFVQKDVAGPPLKGVDGGIYVFRIVDADPAHTPASVDEVREQVVRDLKRLKNFQSLAQSLEAIEKKAEADGLIGLALEHNTQVQRVATISVMNRFMLMQFVQAGMRPMMMPSPLPVIGEDRDAVQAIVDYALTLPQKVPVDTLPDEQRILALPVERKQAILVVRLVRQDPLTQEEFADLVQLGAIQQLIAGQDKKQEDDLKIAFSLETLAKRNNFSYRGLSPEDEQSGEPVKSASNAG